MGMTIEFYSAQPYDLVKLFDEEDVKLHSREYEQQSHILMHLHSGYAKFKCPQERFSSAPF